MAGDAIVKLLEPGRNNVLTGRNDGTKGERPGGGKRFRDNLQEETRVIKNTVLKRVAWVRKEIAWIAESWTEDE